jgi:glycosyltransferase involved in cell wall biosynthesis
MNKNTKFCLVTSNYPPDIGGPSKFASTFPFTLSNNFGSVISTTGGKSHVLQNANHSVFLISRQISIFTRTLKIIWHIWKKALPRNTEVVANGFFVETFIACLLARKSYVAKIPGDIVWEKAKNANLTKSSITDFQTEVLPFKYRVLQILNHMAIRNARKVICPTQELANLARTWGAKKKNINLIPNSVDTTKFKYSNNSNHTYDVICVNRLVEWKGMKEVISACSRLNLKLAIAGTGPLHDELISFSQSIGAQVEFLGDVLNEDLVKYFNSSRIYVLNSTYEATAYSLLEAMSCGLAPIARVNTGSEEVLEQNVNGILVGGYEYPNLLDALSVLQEDPNLRLRIGPLARKTVVDRYDIGINYQAIQRIVLDEI